MVSSKTNNRSVNDYTQIHHRLNQALNLGSRHGKKWQCSDIQIQRQVIRSVSAFLEFVSIRSDSFHNPDFKETIVDIVSALVWILDHTNTTTLRSTLDAVSKLFTTLPDSFLKPYVVNVVTPLSSSLRLCRQSSEVSKSWAKALSLVLSTVTGKNESAVWDILERDEIVCYVISCLKSSVNFFKEVVLLLTEILRRWPRSRCFVWSDSELMRALNDTFVNTDSCSVVELLILFSVIALCGNGAKKLLENGESLIRKLVQCMDSSQPHLVRAEAFKLARYLAANEERFSEIMRFSSETIIKMIISEMTKVRTKSGEVSDAEMSVAIEACRLALIARFEGDHHLFFWKHGIGDVLLNLLSEDQIDQNSGSLEKKFSISNSFNLLPLRNYVWEILGWLAIHCKTGFDPEENGKRFSIYYLISLACSASMDAIHTRNKICQINVDETLRSESSTRAVLMMINSPCECISSKAKSILSELLKLNGKQNLKHFLSSLKYMSSRNSFDRRQITIYVMALTSYIGISEPRSWVIEFSGLKVLLTLVTWCLSNVFEEDKKMSLYSCLRNFFCGKTCCEVSSDDWEGKDSLLFFSLWGLAESLRHLEGIKKAEDIYSGGTKYSIRELVETLCEICVKISSPGVVWFASYALSSIGIYGFPSKISQRIGKVLSETALSDTKIVLKTGESWSAHGVILAIRCPPFISLEDKMSESLGREIRLSGCIDREVLVKFFDYVYFGYLKSGEMGEKNMNLLKNLGKYCNLSSLVKVICHQCPKWGSRLPRFDLSLALGPLGHQFSDVNLESKATEMPNWKCNYCASSVPHFHAHKAILAASCDYLHALFNSGMQESLSQSLKLDLSWGAMSKLITWFYTDTIPNPPIGCLWENLTVKEKFQELEPYLELCSMSKSWLLEEVEESCLSIVVARLESETQCQLFVEIIRSAFGLSLWKLVEVGINYAAPCYRRLCDSGDLEKLDEALVDMIRSASVQYTQEGVF